MFLHLIYRPYRKPSIYEIDLLPNKLPPLKQPVPVTALPMLGYLEQTVATAITNALSAVGTVKPKFPFLSSTSSALVFVAYHLKGKRNLVSNYKCYNNKLLHHHSDLWMTIRPIDWNVKPQMLILFIDNIDYTTRIGNSLCEQLIHLGQSVSSPPRPQKFQRLHQLKWQWT